MHEPDRPRLDQHVAEGGRLDRTGQHPPAGAVGGQLAQQRVLAAAADDVHGVDRLAAEPLGVSDRGRVRLGEALQDAAGEHSR